MCAVIIVVAASGMARPGAQESGNRPALIEWADGRKLTIQDFKGKIPPSTGDASHSWVAIDASWECRDGKGSSQARATFDSNRSWWRAANANLWGTVDDATPMAPPQDADRELLAHEQLHFDLTELWVRKIRAQFKTLPAVCATPGGASAFEKAIADMERDWRAEQEKYDTDTGHGTDALQQRAWAGRVANALKDGYVVPAAR